MAKTILSIVPRGYLPALSGGLEICAMETIEFFSSQGFSCHLAAKADVSLIRRIIRFGFGPFSQSYSYLNHSVYTDIWHPWGLEQLIEGLKPDVVICHVSMCDDLLDKLIAFNLPTLFYIHTREISDSFRKVRADQPFKFACESTYIKSLFNQVSSCEIEIIRPVLPRKKFTVDGNGECVLVVNPHPKKGGEIILKVAKKLLHRQFLIVGGWENTSSEKHVMALETSLNEQPNIKRIKHVSDMRTVFKLARCLFMPCIVEEAYGRTAAEALIAGIPVVASDRGALPETVGRGGVVLSVDSPDVSWVDALEKMFTDDTYYRTLKKLATEVSLDDSRNESTIQKQLLKNIIELIDD